MFICIMLVLSVMNPLSDQQGEDCRMLSFCVYVYEWRNNGTMCVILTHGMLIKFSHLLVCRLHVALVKMFNLSRRAATERELQPKALISMFSLCLYCFFWGWFLKPS